MSADVRAIKRWRGIVVELLYARHQAQQSRRDHVALFAMLQDLGCDVGENDVLTLLQDLADRGYVGFHEKRNRLTNRLEISLIQLTAKGRDVYETAVSGGLADPALTF